MLVGEGVVGVVGHQGSGGLGVRILWHGSFWVATFLVEVTQGEGPTRDARAAAEDGLTGQGCRLQQGAGERCGAGGGVVHLGAAAVGVGRWRTGGARTGLGGRHTGATRDSSTKVMR